MKLMSLPFLLFALAICVNGCNEPGKKPAKIISQAHTIEDLKAAIIKYPDSLVLVHDLIEAYRNKGEYEKALSVTDDLIKKDSGNAYLWNIKATLYFERGDTADAAESLIRAIDIYPMPEYLVALGSIFATTQNPDALLIANELLEFNRAKSGDDAYFIKGLYYNYNNEHEKAITYLDSCLSLDFTYTFAYREKAIALYELKRYEEAIVVLERAIILQNNYDEGYYWLGKCYEQLGKPEDAIQSYQNALLYDKNYVEAREALERLEL